MKSAIERSREEILRRERKKQRPRTWQDWFRDLTNT
jgi:hypothetical protein